MKVNSGGCRIGEGAFVCSPRIVEACRKKKDCPTCKKKTWFWCTFAEWYGWDVTCLSCGDSWADGERCERPFKRGWREEAIRKTKERMKRILATRKTTREEA